MLARLAGLRQARVGQVRVPHKPLLLLWLFGQFAATGNSEASYQQAEEPVSQLINAMCGFDGALGHYPVAIEAAHVRWHSQQGPDEMANALALCALHHALFDLGVLGITEDRRIRVSSLYVARNEAGQAVDTLAGKPLLVPRPRQPTVLS